MGFGVWGWGFRVQGQQLERPVKSLFSTQRLVPKIHPGAVLVSLPICVCVCVCVAYVDLSMTASTSTSDF